LKLKNNDEKQIRDNLYLINYIKPFYKEIDYFKNIIIENIINIFEAIDFDFICQSLYNEIFETIIPKNEINFETIIFQKSTIEVNCKLTSYLMRFNFLDYKEKIIENINGIIHYINENQKIPNNTFRILIYECQEENNIQFYLDKEKYFSAMIRTKDYHSDFGTFKEKFEKKIYNFFSKKFETFTHKNFIYYSTDKEYLNRKNLKNKIKYDLQKLNYSINYKSDKDNEFKIDKFVYLTNYLKEYDLVYKIKSVYQQNIDDNIKKALKLKDEYFELVNTNKNEILEEFACWEIYRVFFGEYLVKKICKTN